MGSTHYKNYLGKRKGFEASKQTPTYKKWRAELMMVATSFTTVHHT